MPYCAVEDGRRRDLLKAFKRVHDESLVCILGTPLFLKDTRGLTKYISREFQFSTDGPTAGNLYFEETTLITFIYNLRSLAEPVAGSGNGGRRQSPVRERR